MKNMPDEELPLHPLTSECSQPSKGIASGMHDISVKKRV